MKKILAFCAALTLATSVYAAPASTASIEQLMVTTKVESLMAQSLVSAENVMGQALDNAIKQSNRELTENDKRLIEKAKQGTIQLIRDELAWANMKGVMVQIYQDSFTQEEVDGLLEFYKSPAGVAMVNKMPLVMHNTMTILQKRLEPMMAKSKLMIERIFAEHAAEVATEATSGSGNAVQVTEKDVSKPVAKAKPAAKAGNK